MIKKYKEIIKKLGKDGAKINEPMAKHTTFKIGGPADLFYEARTEEEIIRAIREVGVPYFILGRGSNILVGDKGFRGMVIKMKNEKLKIKNDKEKIKILADAGVLLANLVNFAAMNSVGGLEFLAGIPGTVGGAVRGNAGAWQQNIGDKVARVKILTLEGQIKWINQKDCQFSYRKSRFKRNDEVILGIEFKLEKKDKKEIERKINEILEKRKNQPKEPSAGCVFVNPKPLHAGVLIEQCGLKGKQIGGAKVSEKHANFIVNLGGAKAKDVVALISLIKAKVKERFGIELKEEIMKVGEF